MIQQTIDELRKLKDDLERIAKKYSLDITTLDKAIIACEQLRKARKKARRWKRKYTELMSVIDRSGIRCPECGTYIKNHMKEIIDANRQGGAE